MLSGSPADGRHVPMAGDLLKPPRRLGSEAISARSGSHRIASSFVSSGNMWRGSMQVPSHESSGGQMRQHCSLHPSDGHGVPCARVLGHSCRSLSNVFSLLTTVVGHFHESPIFELLSCASLETNGRVGFGNGLSGRRVLPFAAAGVMIGRTFANPILMSLRVPSAAGRLSSHDLIQPCHCNM